MEIWYNGVVVGTEKNITSAALKLLKISTTLKVSFESRIFLT